MIREQMKKNIDVITNSLKITSFNRVIKRLLIAMIPIIGLLANDYSEGPDLIGILSLISTIAGLPLIIILVLF